MRESRLRVILEARDQTSRVIAKAQGRLEKFRNFLATRFVFTLGDVARAARVAFDAIKEATDLSSQTAVVRRQLRAQGVEFDAYIAKLEEVADGTLSAQQIIQQSAAALTRGIDAEAIAELLEIARSRSIAFGISVEEAFRRITEGVAKTEKELLDEIGIFASLGEATERYAEQVGKTVEQLSQQERQTAFLNEVIRSAKGDTDALIGSQDQLSLSLQRGTAAMANLRTSASQLAAALGATLGATFNLAAQSISQVIELLVKVPVLLLTLQKNTIGLNATQEGWLSTLTSIDDKLDEQQAKLLDNAAALGQAALNAAKAALGYDQIDESADKAAAALFKTSRAAQEAEPALDELAATEEALVDVNVRLADSYGAAADGLGRFVEAGVRANQTVQREGFFTDGGGIPLLTSAAGSVPGLTQEQSRARTRFASNTFRFSAGFVNSLVDQGRNSAQIGVERDRGGLYAITRSDGSQVFIPGNFFGRSQSLSLGSSAR